MALTETRPETDAPTASAQQETSFDAFLGSGDHKTTGRLWVGAGCLMLLVGLVISLVAGIEHTDLGSFDVVDSQGRFTQLWSMGRELLLFAGVVPVMIGLATFIVPLQVGSSSLAFPRGANAAFWIWFICADLMIVAYALNGGPAGGRADYVLLWAVSYAVMLMAIMWALVCIATTVLGARATGMTLSRVPVSSWSFLIFALGGLFALPVLVAQLLLAYLDVKYGFLGDRDARASLLAVTESATLAPSLYWLGVPILGIGAEVIGVHTGAPIRFRRAVMAAIGVLGIFGFGAEIFAFAGRGRAIDFHNGLLVVALLVAVLPILGSLALAGESLRTGQLAVRTPLIAGLLGGLMLLLGAVAGLLGAVWPLVTFLEDLFDTNISLSDSFVLNGTSFHDGVRGVVMGAAVLAVIAGVHHWGHKIWGRSLDDRLGLLAVLAASAGTLAWGIGGVVSGFLEQPALPQVGTDMKSGVEALNGLSALGAALLGLAALVLLANVARTAMGGGSSNEPWRGLTLEWATASPPPLGNFEQQPNAESALPLADVAAANADETGTQDGESA